MLLLVKPQKNQCPSDAKYSVDCAYDHLYLSVAGEENEQGHWGDDAVCGESEADVWEGPCWADGV